MPDLGQGLLGCFRCGYVWRLRKSPVRICPHCKSRYWDLPAVSKTPKPKRGGGQGVQDVIGQHADELIGLAKEYGGRDFRVFGSVARGEARPDSDVDILVTFDRPIGLLRRAEFEERLEQVLHRRVDVATPNNLHWLIRPQVIEEAIPI